MGSLAFGQELEESTAPSDTEGTTLLAVREVLLDR